MMADCTRGLGGTIATVTEAKTDGRLRPDASIGCGLGDETGCGNVQTVVGPRTVHDLHFGELGETPRPILDPDPAPFEPTERLLGGQGEVGVHPRGPACLLYTSPSPRDRQKSRMPSSA